MCYLAVSSFIVEALPMGWFWFWGSHCPPVILEGRRIKLTLSAWGIAVLLMDMFSHFDFHLWH